MSWQATVYGIAKGVQTGFAPQFEQPATPAVSPLIIGGAIVAAGGLVALVLATRK